MPRWCKPDAYPGPDPSPGLPGRVLHRRLSKQDCLNSQTFFLGLSVCSLLSQEGICSISSLRCNPLPSHKAPSSATTPTAPACLAAAVPVPAVCGASGCSTAGGSHKPHRALGPRRHKEPSPPMGHPGRQQEPGQCGWQGREGKAGSAAGRGFMLHVPCSYTDPSLGKSRLSHQGAESYCTETSACP